MEIRKIINLAFSLRYRKNEAYEFFENVIIDLTDVEERKNAIERLKSCYSITQYADFTIEEEKMLRKIIDSIN